MCSLDDLESLDDSGDLEDAHNLAKLGQRKECVGNKSAQDNTRGERGRRKQALYMNWSLERREP